MPHGDADSRRARAAHISHSGAWPSSASQSMRSLSVVGSQRPTFQLSEPRIGAWPGIVQPIWPASFQTSLLGVALGMVGVGPRGGGRGPPPEERIRGSDSPTPQGDFGLLFGEERSSPLSCRERAFGRRVPPVEGSLSLLPGPPSCTSRPPAATLACGSPQLQADPHLCIVQRS